MNVLQTCLLDPIPEVRATTARAFGNIVKGMGEEQFADLIPWLLENMKSDLGSVERSGAAQGLSEVLAGLDKTRLESLLPEVLANINHVKPTVREGFVGIFIFLPVSMGQSFLPYIPRILPSVLQALADEVRAHLPGEGGTHSHWLRLSVKQVESVRDVALRAAQTLVAQYTFSGLEYLLPPLQEGLFHENWRIRQSSVCRILYRVVEQCVNACMRACVRAFACVDFFAQVQLVGDLLSNIAASTGDAEDSHKSSKAIAAALGPERRNAILSGLYMMRSDVSAVVRQQALLVRCLRSTDALFVSVCVSVSLFLLPPHRDSRFMFLHRFGRMSWTVLLALCAKSFRTSCRTLSLRLVARIWTSAR